MRQYVQAQPARSKAQHMTAELGGRALLTLKAPFPGPPPPPRRRCIFSPCCRTITGFMVAWREGSNAPVVTRRPTHQARGRDGDELEHADSRGSGQ